MALYRMPIAVVVWFRVLRRRHWRALVAHPHHYVTAAGLTTMLILAGHYEAGGILAAWCYALIENVSTVADADREEIARVAIDAEENE